MRATLAGGGEGLERELALFAAPFRGWRGARRLLRLLRWGDPEQLLGRTAALLPQLAMPTLILHGRRDGAIPASFAERAAREIPRAKAVFYDSGHFLPLDLPDEVAGQLSRHFGGAGLGGAR
jgi:pimeloyl-ACP methyl ester carboxylesterase